MQKRAGVTDGAKGRYPLPIHCLDESVQLVAGLVGRRLSKRRKQQAVFRGKLLLEGGHLGANIHSSDDSLSIIRDGGFANLLLPALRPDGAVGAGGC